MPNYRTTLALLTPYSVFLHSILKHHSQSFKVSSAGLKLIIECNLKHHLLLFYFYHPNNLNIIETIEVFVLLNKRIISALSALDYF